MAQRKGCLIGCAVAGVLGTALLAVLGFGAVKLFGAVSENMLDPKVYAGVEVGDQESAVRAKLPSGESFVKDALKAGGPAEPQGATCSWYVADEGTGDQVFRFCFKDGRLAEKVQYTTR
ncbi:hypothetical protein [Streptomyces sp. NPDC093225]|uniref:hypothetical protein n=1 Tax=Streptomyces sp. NPDC093225 TaxID=3366034 RepID=UPI00380A2BA2